MSIITIRGLEASGNISNPFALATDLFQAIRSRDVDSAMSTLNLIKSSSNPALILNATKYHPVLQQNETPFLTVLNQTRMSREEFEADFQIASMLIEAHKECSVGMLSFPLLDTLQFLEKDLSLNPLNTLNPEDLSIVQQLHSAFLDRLIEVFISLDNHSNKTRVECLNELLIYAVENGMPELTRIVLKKGADHTISRGRKSLLQRAVDMHRENRLGSSSVYDLVHKVLWQTQAERFANVNDAARSQFCRIGLVFAWEKKREKSSSEANLGFLPIELIVKVGKFLTGKAMTWPFQSPLDSHTSLVRASWPSDAESRKRKAETQPDEESASTRENSRNRIA